MSLALDDAYLSHYDKDDAAQGSTPYAKKVRAIIAALEDNKPKLFKGVKLSNDFRIYDAKHEY